MAVDFGGTLDENRFPEMGPAKVEVIRRLIEEQKNGARIILWTCREGELIDAVVEWCSAYGLRFDAINDNFPDIQEYLGGNTRKVFANEYWDDRNVVYDAPDCNSCKFRKQSRKPERGIYSWCANACKNFSPKGDNNAYH